MDELKQLMLKMLEKQDGLELSIKLLDGKVTGLQKQMHDRFDETNQSVRIIERHVRLIEVDLDTVMQRVDHIEKH